MLTRRATFALAALVLAALPASAEPVVFTGIVKGVAVGGYDAVAYFTKAKPVPGRAEFALRHAGVEWRFADAANRDAFALAPEKYMPQFGGHCAWAVAQAYLAKGDPKFWKIVDGKLYLNYDRGVQTTWEQNIPVNISKGDTNWPKVANK